MALPNPQKFPPVPTPVRYAEKRRTSTCLFADRIAQFCVDYYRAQIPDSFQEVQKQTCLAAIVAFEKSESSRGDLKKESDNDNVLVEDTISSVSGINNKIFMLGLGVGTKFLSSDVLKEEMSLAPSAGLSGYGNRVRDCHAEALARRAFRRQISLEILRDLQSSSVDTNRSQREPISILQRVVDADGSVKYGLRPNISLHMYASSAPCGNATLKKFATMKQERFRDSFGIDEWPIDIHEPIIGHSVSMGQFALLVKKDPARASATYLGVFDQQNGTMNSSAVRHIADSHSPATKKRKVLAMQSTDWCPPGTSTVWADEGSIHTCSDKICRWNCLGLQGSLLASLLEAPLYMSSLTVGRKLTECICRRAVCCRAVPARAKKRKKGTHSKNATQGISIADESRRKGGDTGACRRNYRINHPTIMGTQVYMDETGVIDMSLQHGHEKGESIIEGQDVRFHNSLSWAWWPSINLEENGSNEKQLSAECIDGATGWAVALENEKTPGSPRQEHSASRLSTLSLFDLYLKIQESIALETNSSSVDFKDPKFREISRKYVCHNLPMTLTILRDYKRRMSPEYEAEKLELLTKHPLFCQWKRREKSDE